MLTRRTVLGTGLALAAPAIAQPSWPSGPVRLVAPFPPGGSVDAISRLLQPHLSASLGVPVVVENKAGASGAIGTRDVARSAPDGNSWVLVFDTHAVNPALISNLGFDTPVTIWAGMVAIAVNLVVAVIGTLVLRGRVADGEDTTLPEDYTAEAGDPGVQEVLDELA